MAEDLDRSQIVANRKLRKSMRNHATRIQAALSKQSGGPWKIEGSSVTEHSVVLRGPNEENLLFRKAMGYGEEHLIVTGLHPGFVAEPDHDIHQTLTLDSGLKPRAIAAEILGRLIPDYVGRLKAWQAQTGWDPRERQMSRSLAEDISGMCGGRLHNTDNGFRVTFKRSPYKGEFTIADSGHMALTLTASDGDSMCELAAQLPRLGNR